MRPDAGGAQRGLAAVELAILLPVFLMLLLGTAELGRACLEYNTLTKSVREGARYLSARALNGAGVVSLSAADLLVGRRLVVYGNPAGSGKPRLSGLALDDVLVGTATADPGGAHVVVTASREYTPLFVAIPRFGRGADVAPPGTMTAASAMVAM